MLLENKNGWSMVRKESGETGYIPTQNIYKTDELEVEPPPELSYSLSPEQERQIIGKAAILSEKFWQVENYGFELVEEDSRHLLEKHEKLYHLHDLEYDKSVQSQRKKWNKVLSKGTVSRSMKDLKKLCRSGIPPELRGQVWFHISGAYDKKLKHMFLYRDLKERFYYEVNETTKQVGKDIERTFPYVHLSQLYLTFAIAITLSFAVQQTENL